MAYISKALGPRTKGLSTYEKEYLAILTAVEQWRPYLQHGEFIISTDQRSLSHLNEQRLNTPWQQKVFTKLLGLQYRIIYKKGLDNRAADALSRKSTHDVHCAAVSVSKATWMDEVASSYSSDAWVQEIIAKLILNSAAVPNYSFKDGILRYNSRIWVGEVPALHQKILLALHSSPLGGHSGVPVTYKRIKQIFAWKGLKSSIHNFVKSCVICQQAKPDRAKLPGLLQPLEVPTSAWQTISMDFVEGLPRSQNFNCILVVVDLFTKYAHFLPLHHPYTAASVAKVFIQQVYKLHGLPVAIVSDRDKIFTSNLWQDLFDRAGVELRMSSSYHPQSYGQTERVNQCMETYLRCFVNACPTKWFGWLPLAEFWYNTSDHSAIARSPFEALYGYKPRHLGISADDCSVPNLSSFVKEKELVNRLLCQHLTRAKQRMKR